MVDVYVYDHVRTPRGRGKESGSLHGITALELTTQVLKAVRVRNVLDTSHVDDVVMGCVTPVNEQGQDIARIAALNADYDESVAGVQINRFCASGLEATNMAAAKVMTGEAEMTIGGGVESMSRVAMGSDGGAWASNPEIAFKSYFVPQGISADLIATKYGYSRDDVDAYAVESQKRAANAWEKGYFKDAVVSVKDQLGVTLLERDEHMRPDTSMQSLASLNPSFEALGDFGFDGVIQQRYPEVEKVNHVHHAGNSSGIVDGAAAVLVGNQEIGDKLSLKPRVRIKAFASVGSEPSIMLTGPERVARKVLDRADMKPGDIDLYELNEAFAAVVLRFMEALDVPHDKLNVNGGAIALGHPLGATGAMILGTVIDEMDRRDAETAMALLCVGAGMGTATIVERV